MIIKDIYIATYLIMRNVEVKVVKVTPTKAQFEVSDKAEELVNRFYSLEKELVLFANTMRNLKVCISNTPIATKK